MMRARFAPFDQAYGWANTTTDATVYDPTVTALNGYRVTILLYHFEIFC